ncbi:DUF6166 domain-containing protein [Marispirochaeta aestuarii]|uniref:DUF6166 domain-containing protein n=1 Tax=Marispirochaeta aestuarii TaxID=1963862 RepID=UPI002ABD3E3A|nr:DUF6166 domain-containing protein [Marispirochaeta aestuarii]
MSSTSCKICHKPLTDPHSILLEMGPVCARKSSWSGCDDHETYDPERIIELSKEEPNRKIFLDPIRIRRIDNPGIMVNVPHVVVYHSPTGFECGYGGSGPSELSLNILYQFLDYPRAFSLHQAFKWEFISGIDIQPGEEHLIENETIQCWIDDQLNQRGMNYD